MKKVPISFGHGCAVSDDMLCVAAFIDELDAEQEFTRMFILNLAGAEPWNHHDIAGRTIVSVALRPQQQDVPRACYALSEYGYVRIMNSAGITDEEVPARGADQNRKEGRTYSSIAHIGDRAYVCGALNSVYRRDAQGWSSIASALEQQAVKQLQDVVAQITADDASNIAALTKQMRATPNLECIGGISKDHVYVCGGNGLIMHWNGAVWSQIKSPTRQHLHAMHCLSDTDVLMCGHNGTLLRGNRVSGFHRVALGRNDINFWSVRSFLGEIYIGTSSGVYTVTGGKLEKINFDLKGVPTDFTVQAIDSTERVLWVVADKFVLRLMDGVWQLITHPDNV